MSLALEAGCLETKAGPLVEQMAQTFGDHNAPHMSNWCVGQVLAKNTVWAELHAAATVAMAKCECSLFLLNVEVPTKFLLALTFGSNSTSHQHEEYDLQYVVLPPKGPGEKPTIISLGLGLSVSHDSASQAQVTTNHITELGDLMQQSPLAEELHIKLTPESFECKLMGINGDHVLDIVQAFLDKQIGRQKLLFRDAGVEAWEGMNNNSRKVFKNVAVGDNNK